MKKVNELNDIRKLATIARIEKIKPIPGADSIEQCRVRGWWVVVKKDEYKIGDLCVYVEVDSIMPDGLPKERADAWRTLNKQMSKVANEKERNKLRAQMVEITKENTRPEFEFLRDKKFHIKTQRIRGEISQGICFPLSILEFAGATFQFVIKDDRCNILLVSPCKTGEIPIVEGEDVSNLLGITQYVAPDTAVMGGDAKGMLQAVGVLVSDEERLENLSDKYEEMRKFRYIKTEKLEGTSFLVYLKDGEFGVCGRTINYKRPDENIPYDKMNVYWKAALKTDLEKKMREMQRMYDLGNFALQGELVGEGIQKNIYGLKGQQICFYNAFNIDLQEYWEYTTFLNIMDANGLGTVPVIDTNFELPENALNLLEEADRTTTVFGNKPNQLIEGHVYVAVGEIPATTRITRASFKRLSFKTKSREYQLGQR